MTVNVSLPANVTVATSGAQGPPGQSGSNGAAGHTPQLYGGAAVPTTLHVDGDLYLRTNGDLYQQVASSWGSPVGNIQGPPGSGGGTSIRTAEARITVENIALNVNAGWSIVTSSGGTPLKCSIKAAAGDRVTASLSFMRTGSGAFLDVAILDNTGAISLYAGSGTSSPLQEGAPAYYPQSTVFPAATGTVQFTVASGQVDGSGNATVALAFKGAGAGSMTIYASATYPWYMLLTNLGPQPA